MCQKTAARDGAVKEPIEMEERRSVKAMVNQALICDVVLMLEWRCCWNRRDMVTIRYWKLSLPCGGEEQERQQTREELLYVVCPLMQHGVLPDCRFGVVIDFVIVVKFIVPWAVS